MRRHIMRSRHFHASEFEQTELRFMYTDSLCLKNTGPGSSGFMINAKTIIGKAKTTIPMKDNTISINRLKKCLYIFVETNFQKIIFYEKHPKNTAKAASRTCRMQLQALQHRRQSLLLPRVQKGEKHPAFAVTICCPKLICTCSHNLFYYIIRQSVRQYFLSIIVS